MNIFVRALYKYYVDTQPEKMSGQKKKKEERGFRSKTVCEVGGPRGTPSTMATLMKNHSPHRLATSLSFACPLLQDTGHDVHHSVRRNSYSDTSIT